MATITKTNCDRTRFQALDGAGYGTVISPDLVNNYPDTTQWLIVGGTRSGETISTAEALQIGATYSDACILLPFELVDWDTSGGIPGPQGYPLIVLDTVTRQYWGLANSPEEVAEIFNRNAPAGQIIAPIPGNFTMMNSIGSVPVEEVFVLSPKGNFQRTIFKSTPAANQYTTHFPGAANLSGSILNTGGLLLANGGTASGSVKNCGLQIADNEKHIGSRFHTQSATFIFKPGIRFGVGYIGNCFWDVSSGNGNPNADSRAVVSTMSGANAAVYWECPNQDVTLTEGTSALLPFTAGDIGRVTITLEIQTVTITVKNITTGNQVVRTATYPLISGPNLEVVQISRFGLQMIQAGTSVTVLSHTMNLDRLGATCIFYGDSITLGLNGNTNGFAGILGGVVLPGKNIDIVACGGAMLIDRNKILKNIQALNNAGAEVSVITWGILDKWINPNFEADFESMVQLVSPSIPFLNPYPTMSNGGFNTLLNQIITFMDTNPDFAGITRISQVTAGDGAVTPDGIHPDFDTHELVSDRVRNEVTPAQFS